MEITMYPAISFITKSTLYNFCTCHDSSTVMALAQFCSDDIAAVCMEAKQTSQQIEPVNYKTVSDMGP